jgi:hypothetical protein
MALSAEQIQAITVMMNGYIEEHRPPVEIRAKLDIGWRLERQSIYIFEIRPDWQDAEIIRHFDYAKATWVQTQKHWTLFWLRASGKWNIYEPLPEVGNLQRFLIEVENDPHYCFKG